MEGSSPKIENLIERWYSSSGTPFTAATMISLIVTTNGSIRSGNRHFFLPNMECMVPLSYLQSMSIWRQMDWDLVKSQQLVSIKRINNHGVIPIGSGRDIIGFSPGLLRHEYLKGETHKQANSFISQFMTTNGEFLPCEFQAMRWVYSSQKTW